MGAKAYILICILWIISAILFTYSAINSGSILSLLAAVISVVNIFVYLYRLKQARK